MADVLIKAVSATHPDPVKDERGCYKRGDLVLARPTGWPWGVAERLPPTQGGRFGLLRLLRDDGVTPVWAVEPLWVAGNPYAAGPLRLEELCQPELDGAGGPIQRRLFRLLTESLPVSVRDQLAATGLYEVPWTAVRSFVQNKRTLSTESATVLV